MLPSAGVGNPIGNNSSFFQEHCSRKRAPTFETSIIMLHNAYQVLRSDGDMQAWEGGKRAADGRCLGLGRLRRASGTVTGPGELLLGASDVG